MVVFFLVQTGLRFQARPPAQANIPPGSFPSPQHLPISNANLPSPPASSGGRNGLCRRLAAKKQGEKCTLHRDRHRSRAGRARPEPRPPPCRGAPEAASTEGTFIPHLLGFPLSLQSRILARKGFFWLSASAPLEPFRLSLRSVAPFGAHFFPSSPSPGAVPPGWFTHPYMKGGSLHRSEGRASEGC